jgi:SRSO17 transposase
MAAKLAPDNVRCMHQSLHHLVADAPWDDEALLDRALDTVLPSMLRRGPVVAWVVDDTGFPKKGKHSVGVTRQYCGQVGKQDNCRVAVSLSVTTEASSMPIAFRLYLPEVWANDAERRKKAGVPEEIGFQTKPQIALAQIRRAKDRRVGRDIFAESGALTDAAADAFGELCEELEKNRTSRSAPGATAISADFRGILLGPLRWCDFASFVRTVTMRGAAFL